jgi:hypothetical protein
MAGHAGQCSFRVRSTSTPSSRIRIYLHTNEGMAQDLIPRKTGPRRRHKAAAWEWCGLKWRETARMRRRKSTRRMASPGQTCTHSLLQDTRSYHCAVRLHVALYVHVCTYICIQACIIQTTGSNKVKILVGGVNQLAMIVTEVSHGAPEPSYTCLSISPQS